MISGDKAI